MLGALNPRVGLVEQLGEPQQVVLAEAVALEPLVVFLVTAARRTAVPGALVVVVFQMVMLMAPLRILCAGLRLSFMSCFSLLR
jgi:hypothetical protein